MFDEFFAKANELRERAIPFAAAVVVRAEAPSSAKPGDKAIVTLDGVMHGWIGGSCAQPMVIEEAVRAIADGRPRLLCLSPDPDSEPARPGVETKPMTCYSGGTLEVYIEPQQPRPTLLVVGHLPVAQALAHLGRAMGYRVVAFQADGGTALEHADETIDDLARIPDYAGPLTYVVVASHGHYDELALEHALRAPMAYVGLVASRKRAAAIRTDLESAGLDEAALGQLRSPAGLDIGAGRGDEIALSILAEIVQHRRNREPLDWSASVGAAEHEGEPPVPEPATAVDPVCGMSVAIASAVHRHDWEDRTYYFCCDGCRRRFAEDPHTHLAAGDRPH